MVYYNEHDPFAAAWLRELIAAGHIAFGVVDERSIEDVLPGELRQFKQCHFFAGIGVWSYALRRAGWSDDRQVWTGSCPCQPFSSAGKGDGFADERHLWPAFHHLIAQCKPDVVFGEQVASKDGLAWLDLVLADLEGTGYAAGAVDTCSAGFGAPHIRQRLYWVADAGSERVWEQSGAGTGSTATVQGEARERQRGGIDGIGCCATVRLADSEMRRYDPRYGRESCEPETAMYRQARSRDGVINVNGRATGRMGDDDDDSRLEGFGRGHQAEIGRHGSVRSVAEASESGEDERRADATPATSPTNGHWRDADWLFCRDGKWRPVESGTFPLAHGAAARVGRLRGYGNALNAEQAQGFIEAYLNATRL